MMKNRSARNKGNARKLWLPILVGACVFIINLLLWQSFLYQEQLQIKRNIKIVTEGIRENISSQIITRTHALERMAERWEFSGGTSRGQWVSDAINYLRDYKGYQALEWVDNLGFVRWIIPQKGNEGVENRALLFEPQRQNAMNTALKTGNPSMTGVVSLIQGGKGFLIYVPLFLKNNTFVINQINGAVPQNFDGYIVGVLQSQTILDTIINKNLMHEYAIAIFDQDKEFYSNELYRRLNDKFINKWSYETLVEQNGVKWRLRVAPTKALLAKQHSPLTDMILVGGSIAAILIASVVSMTLSLRRYASRVEQSNLNLSCEITERQKVEASLQQSTAQLEDLYNNAPCGYHSLDQDGIFIQINDTELKWLGYKREEVIGRKVTDFFTTENQLDFETSFSELKTRGFQRDLELLLIRADGTKMPVLVSATAIKDAAGNFVMSRSTLFDISQRKQAQDALKISEERFRSAFANASIGMALVSPEGRWLQVNESLCQMIGYSKEELLATTFQVITYPDDLEIDLKYVHQMLKGEISTYQMEKRYFHKLGHIVWILLSVSLVWEAGNPLYFVSQIQDITDRKRAESKLREVSIALESAVEGIAEIDARGCYTYVNHAYAEMLDYEQEELIGAEWQITVYLEDLEKVTYAYQEMLKKGKAEVEARGLRKDGSVFDKQVVMVRNSNQEKLTGHYCFVKDISDRREVERLKDEFVSVVSHELRTPLTSIRGSLGLVANGVLQTQPEKAQRMLEIAVNNSDRLIRLINDILDIERIESGKVVMSKQICDAALLMTQSAEVMQAMAEKAGVNITVNPVSARLWADPDRIIQTFTNLLSNAIKFSPSGSTILFTAVNESTQANTYIVFQVKDQGRGIPSDKLEAVFGRFQQVDASDSRKKGGTGLGLAICRSIIQHHDGQIWVESELSQGSTFYVSLPILAAPEPTILPNDANRHLVLVCDDDYSARAVIQTMLEERGYRSIAAASGLEAVEIATHSSPDVILLNLMMPEMNGWEALTVLKQQPTTKNIPVIILSGFMPDARLSTKHPEVNDWIIKPPNENNLFEALERALSTSNDNNLKVLIVEDDLDLAQVLIAIFERYGIEAHHARNGREAIQLSQCLTPYLLVLDIGLPDFDGFAVVDWLRHHNHLHQVPLVVYSAKDLTKADCDRLNLGQTLFLTKARVTPEEFEQRALGLLNCIVSGEKEGRRNGK
ncbi:PAS/PAC sensor hybrid histidine kinase [Calothrix sp. NIES-4071]|nr:PAS/PAC sensor hybrid histidine kinase [Calothrix sp. NIES-4071]BAZ58236.1 PAS/PAC sensor hybrid histidine kinase [Calothrix sp. NIES-4105]